MVGSRALVAGVGTVGQGLYVGHDGFEFGSPLVAVPTFLMFGWVPIAAVVFWLRSNGAERAVRVDGDPMAMAGASTRT